MYHFGVPIIRTVAFWGLYWGSPILGRFVIFVRKHATKVVSQATSAEGAFGLRGTGVNKNQLPFHLHVLINP